MHADLTAAFRNGLWTGTLPAGVTASAPDEAERRFAVYRNNVMVSLTNALAARFPVVEQLVGGAFFAAMAQSFVRANPPASPLLMQYGDRFPAFIAKFPPAATLPYLPDVARLEVARGEAYHAADATPVAPERLAAAATSGRDLRLTLAPSVRLLSSTHPVLSIWSAHQPGGDLRTVRAGAEAVLIGRRQDFTVIAEAVSPQAFAALSALRAHPSLGLALSSAGAGFDPAPMLSRLITHGLLTDAAPGDDP